MNRKSKTIARHVKRLRRPKKQHQTKGGRVQRKPRLTWSRRVEQATLDHTPGDIADAQRLFQSLAMEEKAVLLQELVNTRAVELCRAYSAVIAVAFGFRRRQDVETGRHQIEQEACVKLLVKRKWRSGVHNPKQELPKHLFAYWTIDGARRLCAIPIDVEDSRIHAAARPHAPESVTVSTGSPPVASGALTCVIERSSKHDELYVMSCKHVFSPTLSSTPNFHVAQVRIENDGQSVATTVNIAGILSPAARRSLDSQLAKVENPAGLRTALSGVQIDGYVRSQGEAMSAARLWVVTPTRGPIRARINAFRHEEHSINYGVDGETEDIRHAEIIELQTDNPTRGGDSGSPILTKENGGLLVGMLIAGPPDTVSETATGTLSYAIPAWHILDPKRYVNAEPEAREETWEIVPTP
jgi:hypothetical protein